MEPLKLLKDLDDLERKETSNLDLNSLLSDCSNQLPKSVKNDDNFDLRNPQKDSLLASVGRFNIIPVKVSVVSSTALSCNVTSSTSQSLIPSNIDSSVDATKSNENNIAVASDVAAMLAATAANNCSSAVLEFDPILSQESNSISNFKPSSEKLPSSCIPKNTDPQLEDKCLMPESNHHIDSPLSNLPPDYTDKLSDSSATEMETKVFDENTYFVYCVFIFFFIIL